MNKREKKIHKELFCVSVTEMKSPQNLLDSKKWS